MPHDQIFRIVLVVGMAVIFPVGLYYFLKSGILKEKVDHRGEGMLALLTLRPLAAARAIGVIAFIINPAWMAWSAVPLPLWARWMCVVVGLFPSIPGMRRSWRPPSAPAPQSSTT